MVDDNVPDDGLIPSELVREDSSFADIVMEFVDGLERRLHEMEEAMNKADFEALRGAAHQLKGSGGGYGYPIISETSAQLERHASDEGLEDCARVLNELKSMCQRIVIRSDE